jgi:hypothetical protein
MIVMDGELLETTKAQWVRRKVVQIPGHSPTLLCPYVFHRNGKPIGDIRDVWHDACIATGLGEWSRSSATVRSGRNTKGNSFMISPDRLPRHDPRGRS